jgi:hypothetical protein
VTTGGISVGGVAAISVILHVPSIGPWWADCTLASADDVSGRTTIAIGDSLSLSGTVVDAHAGVFAEQRILRVVAGANGWSTMLPALGYHNDGAGVSARRVANDAATAVGETLGTFVPSSQTLQIDYVRTTGPAARTLEDAIGSASWWVDFDGNTNVGTRSTATADPTTYELLEYDPLNRVAVLAMDDLSSISIGMTLPADERMTVSQTVREIRYEIAGNDARVFVMCGESDSRGRIVRALRSIVRRSVDDRYYAPARYRVIRTNGDRLELQAISPDVPDIGPISMSPGLAGAHSTLTPGTIVLVSFVEGLRTMPIVTHFAGKDGSGFVPVSTVIDITSELKLGANATEVIAFCSKIKDELDAIAASFAAAQSSPSGGPLTWVPPTSQYGLPGRPVPAASALGTTKVKAE